MKRKAILIESSSVKGHTDLPGARLDVQNWLNYLKSDLGGTWEESEIVSLSHPTSTDIDQHLKVDTDTYCFVAFSGHGAEGSVLLNDSWVTTGFPISRLKPKTTKGTLIVDSCRGLSEAARSSNVIKAALANEAGRAVALNSRSGRSISFSNASELYEHLMQNRLRQISEDRRVWEEALKICAPGTVEMLACSKGQGAGEDPKAGGYYTSLLLQGADLWQTTNVGRIYTTKGAHDYAASKLAPQQTPEYRPLNVAFPFAVNV